MRAATLQRGVTVRRSRVESKARLSTVSDYTSVLSLLQCLAICLSQQHGLLQGERLLCVPVVWPSEQLGELLAKDGLLEWSPVVEQGLWVGGESELLNGRHLGSLEAG